MPEELYNENYEEEAVEEPEQDELPVEDEHWYTEPMTDEEEEVEASDEDIDEEMLGEEVPVKYYDPALGTYVKKKVPYADLVKAYTEYNVLRPLAEQQHRLIANILPVFNAMSESNLLQQIATYKLQGYTDEQIRAGLKQIWEQAKEDGGNVPSFDEVEDKWGAISKVVDYMLNQKLSQVESKIKEYEAEKQRQQLMSYEESVAEHNDKLFEKALKSFSISPDELSDEDLKAISQSIATIYPGADLRFLKLSPAQVKIIVKDAMARRKNRSQKQGAKGERTPMSLAEAFKKQKSIPKIAGTMSTKTPSSQSLKNPPVTSYSERKKNWMNF